MGRRKQKSPCKAVNNVKKRKFPELNGPEVEWSKEEKERLLQALHEDKCQNNWTAIRKHVGTRHLKQVKQYTEQLKAEQRASSGLVNIAPKDASPIQIWLDLAEKLKNKSGSDDVAEICIPQVMTIAAVEPKKSKQGVAGFEPNYQKIYTCLGQLLRGQPLPPLFPSDARVLLALLNGVEEKLVYSVVNEQVNFIRQTFREQSKALEDEQLQSLVASLGSTAGASSSSPCQQGTALTPGCSKAQTEEGTPEDANRPRVPNGHTASNEGLAGSSSQQGNSPTSECSKAQTVERAAEDANKPRAPNGQTASNEGLASSSCQQWPSLTSECSKAQTEEGTPEDPNRPRAPNGQTASNETIASSSSQQGPSLTPECSKAHTEEGAPEDANRTHAPKQDMFGQAASNEELASDQTKDHTSETITESVRGRVLRPRRPKTKTKTVEKKNKLASLNPFRVPVHLLNFDLKPR